jgi:cation transport ATPase
MSEMKKMQAQADLLDTDQVKAPYVASGYDSGDGEEGPLNWLEISRVLFVAGAAVAVLLLHGAKNPYVAAAGAICTLVSGYPIFHQAYENITQRRMTMELSMAIAIVAALAIREM